MMEQCPHLGVAVYEEYGRTLHALDDKLCYGREGKFLAMVKASPGYRMVTAGDDYEEPVELWVLRETCDGQRSIVPFNPAISTWEPQSAFAEAIALPNEDPQLALQRGFQ